MIYLDYSATTPVNKDVLESFNKANLDFVGNANSLHTLGLNASKLISSATKQIQELLHISDREIIYTSSSSEANNLAIKGIALKYQNRGKHIITTRFEHSSVYGPLEYLNELGFDISYVECDEYGIVDLNNLKELIREDTILVCVNAVNSELGILQPINEIGKLLKEISKCYFFVDLTQAIGKIKVDFNNIDLASFSGHKIYGLKGIACLVNKKNIMLEPLIHGGKSTSIYRSGTPAHPLIVSISKALRLILEEIDKNYNYIKELNEFLILNLNKYNEVTINSNSYCVPHILNISVLGIKAETLLHALEKFDVYVSTQSACNDKNSISENVLYLTKDNERAKSSIRISLSHLTTKEELEKFLYYFSLCYKELKMS